MVLSNANADKGSSKEETGVTTDGGPQAVSVALIMEAETSMWGSGHAASAAEASSANAPLDDGRDEELGRKIWRSSCMGRAAAAKAAREATTAAAVSFNRERLTEEEQTLAFDRDTADRASTPGESARPSDGVDPSKIHRDEESVVRKEEGDGSDDLQNFSLFTSNTNPSAVHINGPHPAAGIPTTTSPCSPPCKMPHSALNSQGARGNPTA